MAEKIYTIPINDAFDMDTECAICEFQKKEERECIEYTLGASMMEPDARIFTNERGFCHRHISMLFKSENKLSLALVLKTHIDDLLSTFEETCSLAASENQKNGLFSKQKEYPINNIEEKISQRAHKCAVCERVDNIMDKFLENILCLYSKDNDFKTKFLNSKGFCLNHYSYLLKMAKKAYRGNTLKDFCINLSNLQKNNFLRLGDEIDWFTKKFDYRYANEDWKTSRDAVPRGCTKVGGYIE